MFAACAQVHAALCVLQFLIHQCVWLILKGGVHEGRVLAILETDEKIFVFLITQVQQLCLVLLFVHSWFLIVFSIPSLLSLDANLCKSALTGKNQPKRLCVHTMLGNVTCIFFISNTSNLCTVTPYGISYYSSSCVSAVI